MIVKMDLKDYLITKDVEAPFSDYLLDKLRCNRQLRTSKGKAKFEKEAEKHREEYAKKRRLAIQEYNKMVKQGKIIPKTHLERTLETANGHRDLSSTQAARRILTKRGIDWKTGNHILK